MAELSASARAAVGPAKADVDLRYVGVAIGLVVVLAAFALTWAAEGRTPRKLYWAHPFTELESAAQDIQAHLATSAELGTRPVSVPVTYPNRTAPGVTATMHQGFVQRAPTLPTPTTAAW